MACAVASHCSGHSEGSLDTMGERVTIATIAAIFHLGLGHHLAFPAMKQLLVAFH